MINNINVVTPENIIDVDVENLQQESLGKIKNIVIDKISGQVRYVVLAFGGFMGFGEKLFALPWKALRYNPERSVFILNRSQDSLKDAPGFDKDHYPLAADPQWQLVDEYYSRDIQG